ncbi:MAG: sodium/proline symporter [Verrucomicrobia bacterium]|nr:sodium/proline symporter [Verrucomicrobiota bacterium]
MSYAYEFLAVGIYFTLLLFIGLITYRKLNTATDFIIGNRSLNYWLTALAAHASDMSSWLFLAYPASIYMHGFIGSWTAIGLIAGMYLNWQFIAPKIRIATEQYNSMTFSSFFENRLADRTGLIRVFSALVLIFFYTIYISAGLKGMGELLELLFNIPYQVGITIGISIVVPYLFAGGYRTLAWIDLFQGLFLLGVIIVIPLFLVKFVGGWEVVTSSMQVQNLPLSIFPDTPQSWLYVLSTALGWGLGYFGLPHIVTKFMGIQNVSEIHKSKWVGMTWMVLSLGAATIAGAVGVAYFHGTLDNPEHVFIDSVKQTFHPFVVGFVLCAIVAATINAMSSQILVLCSSLTEDLYKRIFRSTASSRELLLVSRFSVIVAAFVALMIAMNKTSTIYGLVNYAWSGIGSSFGPLIILSLYSNRINRYGAWAGIISGALIAAIWPWDKVLLPMIPAFAGSWLAILIVSRLTRNKSSNQVQ